MDLMKAEAVMARSDSLLLINRDVACKPSIVEAIAKPFMKGPKNGMPVWVRMSMLK